MTVKLYYKNYIADVTFEEEDHVYVGILSGIDDIVSFECDTPDQFQPYFEEAVNDYIKTCKEINKKPEQPMLHA